MEIINKTISIEGKIKNSNGKELCFTAKGGEDTEIFYYKNWEDLCNDKYIIEYDLGDDELVFLDKQIYPHI